MTKPDERKAQPKSVYRVLLRTALSPPSARLVCTTAAIALDGCNRRAPEYDAIAFKHKASLSNAAVCLLLCRIASPQTQLAGCRAITLQSPPSMTFRGAP
ncbi:hypothetical protein [Synechococcus sp. PCC 7335]|uniref:hypothetical protein n=1 Tax=Synechococcus sp. (strain ATCC 29403 / PCC 7335) TaxID=91464 RepID=UPI0012FAFA67|nr:hypothetical protein [Synechococcus sp. PCC 7335]